jgi:hypothetical protein
MIEWVELSGVWEKILHFHRVRSGLYMSLMFLFATVRFGGA